MISRLAYNFIKAMSNVETMVPSSRLKLQNHQVWTAPKPGQLKLNVDASVNFNCRTTTIGGLVRDNSGLCLGAFNARLDFCSLLIAEVWAINYNVKWLLSLGFHNVVIESDSLLAIDIIRNPSTWPGINQSLIAETRTLLR